MVDFDDLDVEVLKIDGFDEAALGTACIWRDGGLVDVLVYSGDKICKILQERDKMDWKEAIEYIEFNIVGAYMGEKTPVIVWMH